MPEKKRATFVDTAATNLIRTANDVIDALHKLEDVGIEMQWQLECLWLGDPKDMADYHAHLWGRVPGPIVTEYHRRRHEGPGTVPRMNDRNVVLITKEQVDALVEAATAVREKTS